jgi:cell shape-determining protein MreC
VLPYGADPESSGGRGQITVALLLLLVALTTSYLPDRVQERLASTIQATLLRPFLATQEALIGARFRASRVELLQARVDSLAAILSTQRALADENRRLRSLLELEDRAGPTYRAVSLVRPGTAGSESMFLVSAGARHGVVEGAPVVDRNGLVGVIREVRPGTAVGMDWTHPDFRASAMVADGTSYGIVENRRGAFREEDRLVLTGGAYHESVASGTLVLTSGLGGVYPRGIPIGEVDGVAEVQDQWRKSYWLRPRVEPAAVTHALVRVGPSGDGDLTRVFRDSIPGAAPGGLPGDSAGLGAGTGLPADSAPAGGGTES